MSSVYITSYVGALLGLSSGYISGLKFNKAGKIMDDKVLSLFVHTRLHD